MGYERNSEKIKELRQAFLDALPEETAAESEFPPAPQVYLPPAHQRALAMDTPLVIGGRGAGKTFWFKVLSNTSPDYRRQLAEVFQVRYPDEVTVKCGFAQAPSSAYPDKRSLQALLTAHDAYDIWSAVVFAGLTAVPEFAALTTWEAKVAWVKDHAETVSQQFHLAEQQAPQLLLFDALDSAANTWAGLQRLLKGLLQLAQDFRHYRNLKLKIFLRPDMLWGKVVRAFPDSSKLLNNPARLTWEREDLYALLYQYLGNSRATATQGVFPQFCSEQLGLSWETLNNAYVLPEQLRSDGELQRRLFHALAGKIMGSGGNRGDTWKWLPNHLADTAGYVSPRSFISSIRAACVDSQKRDPQGQEAYPLLWQAIQGSVNIASQIRFNELREDFPWLEQVVLALQGLELPATKELLTQRWQDQVFGDLFSDYSNPDEDKKPLPADLEKDKPETLLPVLAALNMLSYRKDGRVDVPDILRVAVKMTRRGGVPVRG